MKMTNRVFLCTLTALIAMGCESAKKEDKQAGGGMITVTFAGTEAPATGQSRMMQEVADALNRTGRFQADVKVNGALSNDTDDLVLQAKNGAPLVVPSDPGRLASQFKIPDLNILMAPYVLTDFRILEKLPGTAIFKEWQEGLENQGITFVADMYNGFRSFYTVTPVKNVADLKDLRIRGFGNDIGSALAKYLGFANVGIPWGNVPPGLRQKTLDGCEVQVAAAYGSAIYEVVKYLARTRHYMLQSSFVCSTALLDQMPEGDKNLFIELIQNTARKYSNIIASEESTYYNQMRIQGVAINDVDIKEFENAIAPLYTNNDLGFSPGLKDRLFKELGL
jgi:TRAP-type C4-dicarboxylate transport system substrate-binding protein